MKAVLYTGLMAALLLSRIGAEGPNSGSSPAANQQFATGTNTNITNIAKHGADITTRSSRKRGLQHQADNRELLQHNAKLQQQQTLFKNCIQLYIGNSGAISGSSNSSSNTPSGTLELVYPTDTQYESLNVRNFQQAALHRRPLAFALPYTTEDVAAIVKCTNIANIRFTVRSGGHSYEGNSLIHQALVIDMTNMDWVVIDQESDTAKIGAGQRLGEIYKVLAEQGNYVLPAGQCAGVGISGYTAGGGVGLATRKLGWLIDNLIAAEGVTANGSTVAASDATNPELFWALKGGGANFIIVTEWEFKLHKAPDIVSVLGINFPSGATSTAQMIAAYMEWKPWTLGPNFALIEAQIEIVPSGMDTNVTSGTNNANKPTIHSGSITQELANTEISDTNEFVRNESRYKTASTELATPILSSWIYMFYWGPGDEAMKQLQDSAVAKVPGAKINMGKEGSWLEMLPSLTGQSSLANMTKASQLALQYTGWESLTTGTTPPPKTGSRKFKASSLMFNNPLTTEAQEILLNKAIQDLGPVGGRFHLKALGGPVLDAIKPDSSSLPHRDVIIQLQLVAPPEPWGVTNIPWSRLDAAVTAVKSGLQGFYQPHPFYYNYFDCNDIKGEAESWEVYFGDNASKLKEIKNEFDPLSRIQGMYCLGSLV